MRIAEIYASHSGQSVEHILELMSANGGRGRWLSPDEAIAEGLVDRYVAADDDAESESKTIVERTKQGVKALLKMIGVDYEDRPSCEDDINYIPRLVSQNDVAALASAITLDEGQKGAKPTELRSVQDPSPLSECHDARSLAYERDAQLIKQR
jgi:enoyl-CoA hydratase/carnithine racemase